jgi:hypothetical protein
MMDQPSQGLLKRASLKQAEVYAELETLSKKYGADLFRILGQRYFKHERERTALQREIAEREAELRKLQEKAQGRISRSRLQSA